MARAAHGVREVEGKVEKIEDEALVAALRKRSRTLCVQATVAAAVLTAAAYYMP